jgi:hypothetical protein
VEVQDFLLDEKLQFTQNAAHTISTTKDSAASSEVAYIE